MKGNIEAVTVMVGIAVDQRPTAGVIHRPFTAESVWGLLGMDMFHVSA